MRDGLQVQERMTTQIANMLMDELDPQGVGVVLQAEHLCMRMRGVEKQNSVVVTSAMLGVFRSHQETRQEFMTLVHNNGDDARWDRGYLRTTRSRRRSLAIDRLRAIG